MDGDPTVLGMINKNLNVISKDVKEIKEDMKSGAVTMGKHDVRLGHIESDVKELKNGQKKIKESMWKHVNSKIVHYNQGYTETFTQRTWRRKDLIALLTGIFALITLVINHYQNGGQ